MGDPGDRCAELLLDGLAEFVTLDGRELVAMHDKEVVAREVALIVAWLRTRASPIPHAHRATERTVQHLADAIERGEYRRKT